jgi:DNA-binding PadR family transcriptional regulator
MPMAGQLLSTYFQDKTGDKDESEESSLAKALRDLKEAGLISFQLNTGDKNTDKLMI